MGNGLARPILAQPTRAAGQNGLGHFGPFFSGHFLVSPTQPYMGCGLKRAKILKILKMFKLTKNMYIESFFLI